VKALLLSVFASGFGRACLPVFSNLLLEKGYIHARAAALRWSYASFGLGAGITLLGVLVAPLIVRLLFERGAFTSQDTLVVSQVLQMMLLQAPLYLMWIVLQTWLAVSKNYYPIVWACAIAIVTKLITGVWFSEWLGITGVALSTVAMYGVAVGYTWMRATRSR
jgi:peptidoglycan biosynthesis protein MviN/MurJ (putative lipid II flippase)